MNNAATGNADAVTVSGLAGQPLRLHTADGDAAFTLPDVVGRPLWARNAQGTVSTHAYEAAGVGGRPLSQTETAMGASTGRVREQYVYAPLGEAQWQALNLAGSQVELRNNAGISRPLSVSLTGQPLASEQCLLKPEVETPDWATTTPDDTEAPLRLASTYDATGAPLAMTNAAGVTSITEYAINGTVAQTRLAYTERGSAKEAVTLKDIQYRADGVVLSQTAGNGVIERYEYDPRTQLLSRHLTERPAGHPQGPLVISDLHYRYDRVGNILSLEDKGADPEWHNNQQATGLREYTYDTLYRLTSATGRERTPVSRYYTAEASSGSVWAPYSEQYTYDDGNNLTRIRHVGGAGNRTRELNVSEGSNRAMVKDHSLTPETGFLAGGLQKQLADGRALQWLADNQLGKVTPVSRVAGDDDSERYHYADGGTRTRKVHTVQVSAAMQTTLTTYAGGCEIRQRWLAGQDAPQKHIVITEAGSVRVVEDRLTGTVQLRYRFADHLGSVGGETDASGKLISREEYAPYGGTVGRDEAAEEVSNLTQRTMRYSGKEQDATGLYYYGWRYYQPELGRWLSADPGKLIDGINLYRFSRNNPVGFSDADGREPAKKVYHYIEPRAARVAFDAERGRPFYKMNVGFEEPAQYRLTEMAKYYLERTKKGNVFTGVMDVRSGEISMYPTALKRAEGDSGDSFSWQTEYQGEHHDGGNNIVHHARVNPSHKQLVGKLEKDSSQFVGFTFFDLRGVRKDVAGNISSHQTEMSVIYGRSRSLNRPHLTRLNDDGRSGEPSAELPVEMKVKILDAFAGAVAPEGDLHKMLKVERESADFNIDKYAEVEKGYREFMEVQRNAEKNVALKKIIGTTSRPGGGFYI
ncbi:RHS repeat-associated core domain-containing protein [Pseudomonas sp. NY15372]|uniref:RHS repeat-associated core domain-containing protein n=1 Tax=Pseudomonas sp. NY15372 TaxID=3400356 RepID=UPI003A8A43F7